MQLRKIKFLLIGKELEFGINVPLVFVSFRIAIKDSIESRTQSLKLPFASALA